MKTSNMNFGEALAHIKQKGGYKVSRKGWNGKGMYLMVQHPDEHSKMKRPYIYIVPSDDYVVPWVASQYDMLAEDWMIII